MRSNEQTSPQHRLNQKEPHIVILIIMSSFASMGAVIFTPALPEIAQYFHISPGHSQLTITLFFLGYTLGQLIYGPLANRFGRKSAFYIGVWVATLGSLISIASESLHSFNALIVGRLFEALGSSAGLVISFTIISDHYYPAQARRIVSYLMLAFAIVPGVATFTGGLLTHHFRWISCFYFLLVYGLLLLIPAKMLLETAQTRDMHALRIKQMLKNYHVALKNKLLLSTSSFFALSATCLFLYVASAPFIAINTLHLSPQGYGFFGFIPFLGTMLAALVSAELSSHFSVKTLMLAGFIIELVAMFALMILFSFHIINLATLIGCGFVLMFGNCIVVGNGASAATSTLEDKANASAVMNFIYIGMITLGTFLLAIAPGTSIVKLPISFLITLWVMILIWFLFIQRQNELHV